MEEQAQRLIDQTSELYFFVSFTCLTKINKLITIKSTTDEFTPDKIIDKELGALEDPKIYTRTQEVGSSSFFPTPEPSSFKAKPLKNSSLRKKLCFGQDKGFISSFRGYFC